MMDLYRYLSSEALSKMSTSIKNDKTKNGVEQIGCVLIDGTTILIEKHKDPILSKSHLANPQEFRFNDECMASVQYPFNEEIKTATFSVKGIQDLCDKWDKFRKVKELPDDIMGTITGIGFTRDQFNIVMDIDDATNILLDILMDTDIVSLEDVDDEAVLDRLDLIKYVIKDIANNLIRSGTTDKVHLPHIRGNMGHPVEVCEYVTRDTIGMSDRFIEYDYD